MRKRESQACSRFAGGCRAPLSLEAWSLRARQPPDYPLAPVIAYRSIPRERPSGGLRQWYATFQFIPFDPFFSGGIYWSCCRTFLRVEFPAVTLSVGSPAEAGRYCYLPGEREGLLAGRRLQLSHGVAGKICLSVKYFIVRVLGILDAQILACLRIGGWRRLLPLAQAGKEVN
jgi:hypothetical protein